MNWKVFYSDSKQNVAIFVSQEEHCLAYLLYRYKHNELSCKIALIISNHSHAKPLADFYKIPFFEIEVSKQKKENAEQQILTLLKKTKY